MMTELNDRPPETTAGASGGEEVLAFPASVAQQVFWYLEMFQAGVTAFNIPMRFRLDGRLDHALLTRSIQTIIDRHEALRTHFEEQDGELMQVVSPHLDFTIPVVDLTTLPDEERMAEADRLATAEARRPFALAAGPLIRAELLRLGEEAHIFHVTAHHAIFDGSSMTVLTEELAALYQAYYEDRECPLEPLPIQYGDFSVWQKDFLAGPEVAAQLAYWKEKLAGMVEVDVPADRPRPPVKNWRGDLVSALLPRELTDRLQKVAAAGGATLFQLFLAAYMIQLSRYSGREDIAVGTPITGRMRSELEPMIGVFINSLILRTDLSGNPGFDEALRRARDTAFAAVENQDVPFEYLVRELKPPRDAGRNPLFQVNFTHQRSFAKAGKFGGVTLTPIPSRSPGAIFDLHFFMVERAEGWRVTCDFSTGLFDRATAVRMLGHFQVLLGEIATHPTRPIRELEILSPEERANLTGPWAGGGGDYERDGNIGRVFLDRAMDTPDAIAVVHGEITLTYAALRDRALAIASMLRAAGVRPGENIAIDATPSPDMIAGLIGIVLAGASYLPIDPEYPAGRTLALLTSGGVRVALGHPDRPFAPADWPGSFLSYVSPPVPGGFGDLPMVAADAPAYVLFTSGSTGTPKGVVVPHRAVLRLVRGTDWITLSPEDVFVLTAPLAFDASTFEIWAPLLNGARLVMPAGGTSIAGIASAVRDHQATHLWLTSGLFQIMIEENADDLQGLKTLITGGEAMSPVHARLCLDRLPGVRLLNGYGPTENTTFSTVHVVRPEDVTGGPVPIGRPISNTVARIVDAHDRLVPVGVPGELLVGGDGLAIGYQNDAALTAEKFPELVLEDGSCRRFYRTGDRCRWSPEGHVIFEGRADEQVKVRGYRIEPGEVEAVLAGHPAVRRAKVAARGATTAGKRLLAWVQAHDGTAIAPGDLQDWLAARLPAFLRPDAVVVVDGFPVTPNGKVDVAALPEPGPQITRVAAAEAPVGEVESRLAAIWQEFLGRPVLSRHDDFFALGGHSLLALRLFSRINREWGKSLPLATLIHHPTLAALAALLQPASESRTSAGIDSSSPGHWVCFKAGRAGVPPMICIHGGDGAVLFYREFAALLPGHQPVFAIESLALGTRDPIQERTIEETAAAYAALVIEHYPAGPVRLAGYSFGGVVAHAMACLLHARGRVVDFLGFFDTHNPRARYRRYTAAERLAVFWEQKRDLALSDRLLALGGRITEGVATHRRIKAEVVAARTDGPAEEHSDLRRVQIREENWRAMQAYDPPVFPGQICLFKAMTRSDKVAWPDDYGWSPVAGQGLDIIPVPGAHLTLFDPENVADLAQAVQVRLQLLSPEA